MADPGARVSVAGKGIVIADGASGLGLATVEKLAARGARIAIIDAAQEVLPLDQVHADRAPVPPRRVAAVA